MNSINSTSLNSDSSFRSQKVWDVLVIGGGPGGTTTASLLAKKGHDVLLLEKEAHPRFHIGESLLPNNLPILERLGILNDVKKIGLKKAGADFTLDEADSETKTFLFNRAIGNSPSHAYEVKRSEFDKLLFEHCHNLGVEALQQHEVTSIGSLTSTGTQTVTCRDDSNVEHNFSTRFIVDASGRHSFLARKNSWKNKNPRHASAAIFGHFENVPRRDGDNQGNISIYWFDQGWLWMIPLQNSVMSVGAVCWPEYLKSKKTDTETFLLDTVARSPAAKERMKDAVSTSSVCATGNYSYRSSNIMGDGYILIGDAYAFIDPVFSSGVYLAMNSAEKCIPVVDAWLSGNKNLYKKESRKYKRAITKKIDSFSWFIYRFTTPTMRDLFKNPRNDWQVEQAVISMLAGDGDGSGKIQRRIFLFKLIFQISRLRLLKESIQNWKKRRHNLKLKFEDEHIITEPE